MEQGPVWRMPIPPQRVDRLVPFIPLRQRAPVVLLAIPRCGAGSVARFLERIYGTDGVTRNVGMMTDAIFARRTSPVQSDCLVADLPLVRWLHFAGASDYLRVTVLRSPWARLVSHINHLAEIGPDEAATLGSSQRALAEEVMRTDFTSRAGVERFFNRLRLIDVSFDNIQVRMLVTGTMSALVKQVTPRDVDVALRELERFAVVGFCEEQLDMQRAVLRVTGAKVPVGAVFEGAAKGSALSVRNTVAREVLAPLYELDQELYAKARVLMVARQG
ncbi:MAG: hypothetical protein RL216_667 [Pseudomonadota bacterium]|jgi:hypothetical protein